MTHKNQRAAKDLGPRLKIPLETVLPGGFRVSVKYVSHARLQELNADTDEVESLWHWDEHNGGTVYLQLKRPFYHRVKDYIHEMGHAFNEWRTWYERKAGGIG